MAKKQITIPLFIPHLGCPHTCAFCNQFETSGIQKRLTKTKIHQIIDSHLESAPDSVKHIEVAFFGGSFTAIPQKQQIELLESVKPYILSKKVNEIRLSTRPDYIDSEKLNLLKEYNVSTIELGIQSFSPDVLIASKRGHTVEDSLKAINMVKEHDFNLVIQLMPGLPKDTKEKSIISAQKAVEANPKSVRIYPTVVLEKTELEELYNKNEFTPLTLEEAISTTAEMKKLFDNKNIIVIRMGLHPFNDAELKSIIAGPYHPSFGFFVKSRIKRDVTENLIKQIIKSSKPTIKKVEIQFPFTEKEEYIGYKKNNITYLSDEFNLNIDYSFEQINNPKIIIT